MYWCNWKCWCTKGR